MDIIGVIAEYNPFHNGHLYHLNQIKAMYPNSVIICVLSGNFMQRGEVSIINKWDKTSLALEYGIDIVVELPYPFASQSADIFAKGAISILKEFKVNKLIFGSECNNIQKLKNIAAFNSDSTKIKTYLKQGFNYPKALSLAMEDDLKIDTPNDILGIAYIKEILRQRADIDPICIKRTNNYHNSDLNNNIISASSIRALLTDKKDVKNYVPEKTYKYLNNLYFIEDYYPYLKYKIISEIDSLDKYQIVDEGIENRIKKYIFVSNTLEELIFNIKTKRYTYNKIKRMLTHILCNFTKEEASKFKEIEYLRLLGFNNNGQVYLNKIKKELNIPLISKFDPNNEMLALELRVTSIYSNFDNSLIELEYKNKPIKK